MRTSAIAKKSDAARRYQDKLSSIRSDVPRSQAPVRQAKARAQYQNALTVAEIANVNLDWIADTTEFSRKRLIVASMEFSDIS